MCAHYTLLLWYSEYCLPIHFHMKRPIRPNIFLERKILHFLLIFVCVLLDEFCFHMSFFSHFTYDGTHPSSPLGIRLSCSPPTLSYPHSTSSRWEYSCGSMLGWVPAACLDLDCWCYRYPSSCFWDTYMPSSGTYGGC